MTSGDSTYKLCQSSVGPEANTPIKITATMSNNTVVVIAINREICPRTSLKSGWFMLIRHLFMVVTGKIHNSI